MSVSAYDRKMHHRMSHSRETTLGRRTRPSGDYRDIRRSSAASTSARRTRRAPLAGPTGSAARSPRAIMRAIVAREHPSVRAASACVITTAEPVEPPKCRIRAASECPRNVTPTFGPRSSSRRMRHERPYFRAGSRPARICARTDSGCIWRIVAVCSTVRSSGRSSRFVGALVTLECEPISSDRSALRCFAKRCITELPVARRPPRARQCSRRGDLMDEGRP
jgi:hypothetical protein